MNEFSDKLRLALTAHSPRKKYLIGVSGGRDSLALLHALHTLGYRKLVVCHLNHGLRGRASGRDAALVRREAKKLGLPFEHSRAPTLLSARREKKSLELAARDLRRAFFASCARRHRCPRIFLAHHADDQVETSLFNFLRGAGAAGIAGIRPVSRLGTLEIIRPMLAITRAEITAYAQKEAIPYRDDESNASLAHTRNRLRHDVLPAITRAMGESSRAAILRAAAILREENAWLETQVPLPTPRLRCRDLLALPLALRRRLVLRWLAEREITDAGFEETERVLSLLDVDHGPAKINLPGGRHARRRAGEIFLEP